MLSFAISIRRLPGPLKATFSPPASRGARPNNLAAGAHPKFATASASLGITPASGDCSGAEYGRPEKMAPVAQRRIRRPRWTSGSACNVCGHVEVTGSQRHARPNNPAKRPPLLRSTQGILGMRHRGSIRHHAPRHIYDDQVTKSDISAVMSANGKKGGSLHATPRTSVTRLLRPRLPAVLERAEN